jgi:hypothetical protein
MRKLKPQLILKCMVWRRNEKYIGVGLCKNMDPISSHVIVFTSNQPMVMYNLANCSSYA